MNTHGDSSYDKNYKYVIQRILQNIKKGYYRNLNHFEEDLQKIQDKQIFIENERQQHNYIETEEPIEETDNSNLLNIVSDSLQQSKNQVVPTGFPS